MQQPSTLEPGQAQLEKPRVIAARGASMLADRSGPTAAQGEGCALKTTLSTAVLRIGFAISGALLLLGLQAFVSSGDEADEGRTPGVGEGVEPVGEVETSGRLAAALADVEREASRVRSAQQAYALDRATADVDRRYLVSFTRPVSAADLLGAASASGVGIEGLHVWLQTSPSSVDIITGRTLADAIQWSSSDVGGATARLAALYVDGVTRRISSITQLVSGRTPRGASLEAVNRQLDSARALLAELNTSGPDLYGIECTCSPADLDALLLALPELSLRSVEAAGSYQFPIWPYNPSRQLIIETGGSYGR